MLTPILDQCAQARLRTQGFEPASAKRAAEAAGGHLESALNWLVAYADSPELEVAVFCSYQGAESTSTGP